MPLTNPLHGVNNKAGQCLCILLAVDRLARATPQIIPNSATIAREMACSVSYVEQGLRLMRLAGYVESHRGPGGGYTLALPLEAIDVLAVIHAANEKCNLNHVLALLFGEVTLADLAEGVAAAEAANAAVAAGDELTEAAA